MTEVRQIPVMVTVDKASDATGITKYRLREWCKEKRITCIRCGNRFLINLDKLIEYLNEGDRND